MNPIKWVRWKVVIVLAVIGGVLYLLGLNPLTRMQINGSGARSDRARWGVSEVDLALLSGDVELTDLLVATARAAAQAASSAAASAGEPDSASKDQVFYAARTSVEIGVEPLLRRRFEVDRIHITTPRLRVDRRPDGSTNIGDLGTPPEETAGGEAGTDPAETDAPKEPTDWVEVVRKWYERIQKVHEKLGPDGRERTPEEIAAQKAAEELASLYERRATYPFRNRPRVIVHEIIADGLEIDFAESAGSGTTEDLPTLTEGSIQVTGLSDRPEIHSEPIELHLRGKVAGADLVLDAVVDLRDDRSEYKLHFDTGELPAGVVGSFVGASLPVRVTEGSVRLVASPEIRTDGTIDIRPELSFRGVQLAAKEAGGKIAGTVDVGQFVMAFNEASRALEDTPLKIADLHITGTVRSPRFEWGDTLERLVVEGGKAFARAQLARLEGKVLEVVDEGARKLEEGIEQGTQEIQSRVEEAIGGSLQEKADELEGKADELEGKADELEGKVGEAIGAVPVDPETRKKIEEAVPDVPDIPEIPDVPKIPGSEDAGKAARDAIDDVRKQIPFGGGLFGGGGKASGSDDK